MLRYAANNDFVYSDNTNTILAQITSTQGSILIPSTIVHIQANAIKENHNIVSISFQEGSNLETLEKEVFAYSSSLKVISFEFCKKLKILPKWCFRSSKSLSSITFPPFLTTLSYGCFCYTNVSTIILPNSIETIESSLNGEHATFHCCYQLITFIFPIECKLTKIPQRMFWGCSSLSQIVLPPSITYVEEGIFGGCTELKQVSFLSKNIKFDNDAMLNLNEYQTEFYVVNQMMKNKLINDKISKEKIFIISKQHKTSSCISPRLYTPYILISLFCK